MKFSLNESSASELEINLSGELQSSALQSNFCDMLNREQCAMLDNAKSIILDCDKVARVDTSGLAWLLNAVRDLKAKNKQVRLKNVPSKVMDLAALSNAKSLLD